MSLKMSNKERSRIRKQEQAEKEACWKLRKQELEDKEDYWKREEWFEKEMGCLDRQAKIVHARVFFLGFAAGLGFSSVINYLIGV